MSDKEENKSYSKLFISFGTIGGFVIFALVITVFIVLEVSESNPFSTRITSALLGLTVIIFLFGIIIDQLNYRNFHFWALGAMVSFIGVLCLFSPIVFYGLGNNDTLIWIVLIILGIILILFGYTIEAYDLNNKFAKILINLWENFRNFEWKKIPGKIISLIGVVLYGFLFYIALGFRKIRYVIKKGFLSFLSFLSRSLNAIIKLIVSLPRYIAKSVVFCYEYNYFLIIPLFLFASFTLVDFKFPIILIFILTSLIVLLVIMATLNSNKELSQRYLQTIRNRSWETLQSISLRIQKVSSSIGRYRCQNCNAPLKLGQDHCEACEYQVKQCSICKLPIKKEQKTSVCSHCLYPAHSNHWDQWIRMNNHCPICKQ